MAKILDIALFYLEQIEDKPNKQLLVSVIPDSVSTIHPQGQDGQSVTLSGAIYDIDFVNAEVQKKQVFGLCYNYYKNGFLVYLQIDNSLISGWYKITSFNISQTQGPSFFPFTLTVINLHGQAALFWDSRLIFNEYQSNYQYFTSLSSGYSYTCPNCLTVPSETGNVTIKTQSDLSGQLIPPPEVSPTLSSFYNGKCIALNRFRISDNNLYRTFQPGDNVEQINNGLVGAEWDNGDLKILIWDTQWFEVAKLNILITEIARRAFAVYLPYVVSNPFASPSPPTGPPSDTGGGVISPLDDGVLADFTKPTLMGVNINRVDIKTNTLIKGDAFIKPAQIILTIKKGLPIVWLEFRTGDDYGVHHESNLETLGGLTIDTIENENESGLPTNGLLSISRWGKAVLSNGMEIGFIWTRLKQSFLSDPAYPRPGSDKVLNLSRITPDRSISCLGIFGLKQGHGYDVNQLSELFYGNSTTYHSVI